MNGGPLHQSLVFYWPINPPSVDPLSEDFLQTSRLLCSQWINVLITVALRNLCHLIICQMIICSFRHFLKGLRCNKAASDQGYITEIQRDTDAVDTIRIGRVGSFHGHKISQNIGVNFRRSCGHRCVEGQQHLVWRWEGETHKHMKLRIYNSTSRPR